MRLPLTGGLVVTKPFVNGCLIKRGRRHLTSDEWSRKIDLIISPSKKKRKKKKRKEKSNALGLLRKRKKREGETDRQTE